MSVKVIDISHKDFIYREAKAVGKLVVEDIDKVREILPKCKLLSESTSKTATRYAWAYLPLLHTIPIVKVDSNLTIQGNEFQLEVQAKTIAQTGVEMDVLFGCFVGLLALWSYLRESNVKVQEIKDVVVEHKVKIPEKSEIEVIEEVLPTPCVCLGYDLNSIIKVVYDQSIEIRECRAYGEIKLRRETIERIRQGQIEKGDVLTVSKVASIHNCKRVWELVPYTSVKLITNVNVEFEVMKDSISVYTSVKSRSIEAPVIETLFSAGLALINVWDMVKKYEKDEYGQYRYTKISTIRLSST